MAFNLIVLLVVLLSTTIPGGYGLQCSISMSEYLSIFELYSSCSGPNWKWNTSLPNITIWAFPSTLDSPCSNEWQGLTCASVPFSAGFCVVSEVSLPFYGLKGGLPESIGGLAFLTLLELNDNSLNSTLPNSIGNINHLLFLNISNNLLTGSIPSSFYFLNKLEVMSMAINSLTGQLSPAIAGLTSLEALLLRGNNINGTIPSVLFTLSNLAIVDLSETLISGTLPNELGLMVNLYSLNISFARLTGTIPASMCLMRSLNLLYLGGNQLNGTIPSEFGQCWHFAMRYLSLKNNQFSNHFPASLSALKLLEILDISSNDFSGPIPFTNTTSTSLSYIDVGNNRFTGTLIPDWSRFTQLQYFYAYNNSLGGSLPSFELVEPYKNAIPLLQFSVAFNSLTGTLPEGFWIHTNLTGLALNNNNLRGTLSENFTNLQALFSLDISHNSFSGPILEAFANQLLPSLTYINLANNLFNGLLPAFNAPNLTILSLSSNCFSALLPSSLCNLTRLEYLLLDSLSFASSCSSIVRIPPWLQFLLSATFTGTDVHGSIPTCYTQLPNLQTLQLSGNRLTGTIPSLPFSDSVNFIEFGYNALTGTIPYSMQMRGNLQYLSLRNNKLTGLLDESFMNMTTMEANRTALHLTVNRLSGRIPSNLLDFPVISLLNGNLFGCAVIDGIRELPIHDKIRKEYICGSNQLDIVLYLWMSGFCIVAGAILIFFVIIKTIHSYGDNRSTYLERGADRSSNLEMSRTVTNYSSNTDNDTHERNKPLAPYQITADITDKLNKFRAGKINFGARQNSVVDTNGNTNWDTTSTVEFMSGTGNGNSRTTSTTSSRKRTFRQATTSIASAATSTIATLQTSLASASTSVTTTINAIYFDLKEWLAFQTISFQDMLPNTAHFLIAMEKISKGSLYLASIYLVVMLCYIVLKSCFGLKYSTRSMQYTWITTSVYLHNYLPATIILVVVAAGIVAIVLSFRLKELYSTENKHSVHREQWAITKRYSTLPRVAAIITRTVDYYFWPLVIHLTNASVVIAVNVGYVMHVTQIPAATVLLFQLSMSLFKTAWVNLFIPTAMQKLRHMGVSKQFRQLVTMLLVNYIVGPGIATCVANQDCFYYAIHGATAEATMFINPVSICRPAENVVFVITANRTLQNATIDTYISCSLGTPIPTKTTTNAPFVYSYQCGSAFLVDYIPVLLYSYLLATFIAPIGRMIMLHCSQEYLEQKMGKVLYRRIVANSILDINSTVQASLETAQGNSTSLDRHCNASSSSSPVDNLVGANQTNRQGSTEFRSTFSASRIFIPLAKVSSIIPGSSTLLSKNPNLYANALPLFDGTYIIAKRILDVAVMMTFGIACPLLAVAVSLAIFVQYITWKCLIAKYLLKIGKNNLFAAVRIERSFQDGLLRGTLGGLGITILAISMFWSLMFYDMIADQYGIPAGTKFALSTLFCLPGLAFILSLLLRWLAKRQITEEEAEEPTQNPIITHDTRRLDLQLDPAFNGVLRMPSTEQNSSFQL